VRSKALLGLDPDTITYLALPAALAMALAYWLADQQDPVRAGDMVMTKENPNARASSTEDEVIDLDMDYDMGSPIKCKVGTVGDEETRTFFIPRALGDQSSILTVEVQRPAGILFEEDEGDGLVRVVAIQDDSNAAKLRRIGQLTQQMEKAPEVGDVLRAFSTTSTVYGTGALTGTSLPKRELQFILVDDMETWDMVADRLRRGRKSDGPAVYILERPTPGSVVSAPARQ